MTRLFKDVSPQASFTLGGLRYVKSAGKVHALKTHQYNAVATTSPGWWSPYALASATCGNTTTTYFWIPEEAQVDLDE